MADRKLITSVGFRGPTSNRRLAVATRGLRASAQIGQQQGEAQFTADAVVTPTSYVQRIVSASALAVATIRAFVPADKVVLSGGGHWKHLYRPLREVSVDPVKVSARSAVRVVRPTVGRTLQIPAEVIADRVVATSRVTVELPATGVMPPMVRVSGSERVRFKKPKCGARSPFTRATSSCRVNVLPPIPEVTVMPVSIRRKTYYGYYTPETVQNPTEEMMYFL